MKWTWLIALFAFGLAVPSEALGAGGPVLPVQGGTPIAVAGSPFAYGAFGAGRDTVVKRISRGGATESEIRVSGSYGVPGVAYGGPLTGLSADGRTLVLAGITGSAAPRTTRLLVIDTPRLAVREKIALTGWSTVDAISPNGRWLYLIHYASSNVSRYEVQAYDLAGHRLLAKPIVDPHDRGEAMIGFPITRVASADGRWDYTLYARPSGAPFVHALDTAGLHAVCVDLPSLANSDLGNVHLYLGGGGGGGGATLRIQAGFTQVLIHTRTFAVSSSQSKPPSARAPRTRHAAGSHGTAAHGAGGVSWGLLIGVVAALAAVLTAAWLWERPASAERTS